MAGPRSSLGAAPTLKVGLDFLAGCADGPSRSPSWRLWGVWRSGSFSGSGRDRASAACQQMPRRLAQRMAGLRCSVALPRTIRSQSPGPKVRITPCSTLVGSWAIARRTHPYTKRPAPRRRGQSGFVQRPVPLARMRIEPWNRRPAIAIPSERGTIQRFDERQFRSRGGLFLDWPSAWASSRMASRQLQCGTLPRAIARPWPFSGSTFRWRSISGCAAMRPWPPVRPPNTWRSYACTLQLTTLFEAAPRPRTHTADIGRMPGNTNGIELFGGHHYPRRFSAVVLEFARSGFRISVPPANTFDYCCAMRAVSSAAAVVTKLQR